MEILLWSVENLRDPLEYVEAVEGPEDEISRTEIEKAIKQMPSNKAPGPSGITAEMIKAFDELGVDWLHTILNEFLTDERVPGDLKESEIVTIYKQIGDAFECGDYRGIKLLEIALKVYERVIERCIRETVHIYSNQFGFMPGRSHFYSPSSAGKDFGREQKTILDICGFVESFWSSA